MFQRGPGLGFKTTLIALLALGIWFADQRDVAFLSPVRSTVDRLLQPLRWLGTVPEWFSSIGEDFRSNRQLAAENHALREAQLKSQAELLRLEALEAENRRIRQLMASSSALEQKVLIAEIVSNSQDPYRHQITLNKGARDGVYFGQAIVDAYGVMGQVIRVNPTSSTALLVTDPGHGIPVEINRTGLQTVARGGGNGRVLTLPFLPGNADVKVGDLLVSSGLDGRFPSGYPVGEIFDVRKTTGEHFMEASAYPSARLNQGRQALLVWSEAGNAALVVEPPDAALSGAAEQAALAAKRLPPPGSGKPLAGGSGAAAPGATSKTPKPAATPKPAGTADRTPPATTGTTPASGPTLVPSPAPKKSAVANPTAKPAEAPPALASPP